MLVDLRRAIRVVARRRSARGGEEGGALSAPELDDLRALPVILALVQQDQTRRAQVDTSAANRLCVPHDH